MPAPALGLAAKGIVRHVVDGDTIDIDVMVPMRIRLLDCWAPEVKGEEKEQGLISKSALEKLAPVGCQVTLSIPAIGLNSIGDVTSLGRILADVWRLNDDESLSQHQVADGKAVFSKTKPVKKVTK